MQRDKCVYRGMVLVGPTGSGKSPLGDLIQRRGLWGLRCWHFDFGANLREVVDRNRPDAMVSRADIEFLRGVLASGALLEDEQFPLAARILRSFLVRHAADAQSVVVLNGLPRHVGQATALQEYVDVGAVIHLACSGETVLERIAGNVGGDRTGRSDDDLEAVRNKLRVFDARTAPLLAHYSARGARIETVEVTAGMTPEDAWQELEGRGACPGAFPAPG